MSFPVSPNAGDLFVTAKGERWEFTGNGWYKPTVNLKMILTNKTLLVGSDYPTLNEAVTGLANYYVGNNVVLTIQLPAGLTTLSATCKGYNGQGTVRLKGATMVGVFPTSSDVTVTGTGTSARGNDATANHNMCVARFGSRIYCPGQSAFDMDNLGMISQFEDLYIYGDGANGTGILVREAIAVLLTNVAISKFQDNLVASAAGRITGVINKVLIFGAAQKGVNCYYGSIFVPGLISIGNGDHGLQCSNNGFLGCNDSTIAGNLGNGINAIDSCYVEAKNVVMRKNSQGNGGYGIRAYNNSNVCATGSTCQSQAQTSYFSARNSYIDATGYTNSPTFDPAANTIGNSKSYITA